MNLTDNSSTEGVLRIRILLSGLGVKQRRSCDLVQLGIVQLQIPTKNYELYKYYKNNQVTNRLVYSTRLIVERSTNLIGIV